MAVLPESPRIPLEEAPFAKENGEEQAKYMRRLVESLRAMYREIAETVNQNSRQLGDVANGNYISFEEDGTIKFNGDATVYDDLRVPVTAVRLGGGGSHPPTETAYKGGIVLAFDTGPSSDCIQFVAQIPHSYKEGSEIECHIHWVIPTSGAGGGAENVKWDMTYSWANTGDEMPAETSASVTVDVQDVVADINTYTDIVDIDGTGKEISSMLICSLCRDPDVANDYTDDAYLFEIDFHFEIDTLGSRTELVK